jgi:hypothetical protein
MEIFFINLHNNSCKESVIIVAFQSNLNFHDRVSKNGQISNFMKIRPMGTEFFHSEKRTNKQRDMIPISRPTVATCDRFLFSIYMYNSTCFERQALIIRSPSPYIQLPVSVFVSV